MKPVNTKMIQIFRPLALIVLFALPSFAWAQTQISELQDGKIVRIDPATRTATLYSESGSTQLWDGTHRLRDGSVIIVHDGVVVSEGGKGGVQPIAENETLADPRAADDDQHPIPEEAACVKLAIKVCGFDGECRDSQGCSPARQLVELEKEEAWSSNHAPTPNHTTMQCQQALNNEAFFTPCNKKPESNQPTECEQLVNAACGLDEQCEDSQACAAARQLFQFELEERIEKIRRPERIPTTSKRCRQARQDPFFKACDSSGDSVGAPQN